MRSGYTLVIPTLRAAPELRLCLGSLRKNSRLDHEYAVVVDVDRPGIVDEAVLAVLNEFGISPLIAERNIGPYAGWNRGAAASSRKWICFLTDDQYFAPDWDSPFVPHLQRGKMFSSTLVESGTYLVGPDNLEADFGVCAEDFDEAGFLGFVRQVATNQMISGGHFIPLLIHRDDFTKVGAFKEDLFYRKEEPERPPLSSDVEFVARAFKTGLTLHRSLASYSYHFMGASHRGGTALRQLLRYLKPSWSNESRLALLRSYMDNGRMPPEVLLYQGLQALQHGEIEAAERVFLDLLESDIESGLPYLALSAAAQQKGDAATALAMADLACQVSSDAPRAKAFRRMLKSLLPSSTELHAPDDSIAPAA
ncbi:MAG: glycosyltransferase [Nitrospirae bacterium]|nr:glycosyltransferase [Nitrospirota bacterium]